MGNRFLNADGFNGELYAQDEQDINEWLAEQIIILVNVLMRNSI